ncbi:Sorting and assembly machinery component 50 homolog [Anthophora retusa]
MGTVHAKDSNMSKDTDQSSNKSSERQNFTKHDSPPHFHKKMNPSERRKKQPADFHTVKTRVDRVHVDGLIRTKDDIIKAQVTDLFKAKNFYEVILQAYKVRQKLQNLGCFGNVGIFIDTSQGPRATPEGVEVTFIVREMRRLTGGISTMVGNNEGSVIIQAKAPNLFGRGERVQMEYSYGSKSSTNSISVIKPFLNSWLHTVLTASVFNTFNKFPWSGFDQTDKGFLLDIARNPDGAGIIKHNLQYEATYREIIPLRHAAFSVREHCGPNLKSALRHICAIDKRDSLIFPTMGSLIQFSTEVAGLGGNIGFVKNELTMQTNWTPHEYLTFQLGFQSGLLREIGSENMKINIADRFFLGGPLNLRGFSIRGCGSRDQNNSTGDGAYWAIALHLYTPLPFRPGRNGFGDLFKLHGFINGGNATNFTFKSTTDYKENMKIFTNDVRCAVGGGIVMQLGSIARVELNLVMPLLYLKSDVLQQFQFGIGLQYL